MDSDTNAQTRTSTDPAEGRPDLGILGVDRPNALPGREDELPEQLGKRISDEMGRDVAGGEPDIRPDVEIPESTM